MLVELLETSLNDTAPKGYVQFINDYTGKEEDLYIVFSDMRDLRYFKSNTRPFVNAMVAYPISYVLNNAALFSNVNTKYINIIKLKGVGVELTSVTEQTPKQLMLKLGFSEDAVYKLVDDMQKKYRNQPEKHLTVYLITKYNNKLKIPFIKETIPSNNNILSLAHNQIVFITKPFAFEQETFYLNRLHDTTMSGDHDVRKLAAFISDAMGKSLSNDDPVKIFTDYIYWTNDGIEMKITKLLSVDTQDKTNDSTYYIIEIDTPNGIILFNTNPQDTFSEIQEKVRMRYGVLNTPNDNWEPKSRDLYLSSIRKEYKMYDMEKSRYTNTVNEYYPVMRSIGKRIGINIPHMHKFSDLDKIAIYLFMEKFLRKQKDPLYTFQTLSDGDGFKLEDAIGRKANTRVTVDVLGQIVEIYDHLKKLYPSRNGWHILEKYKDE